MRPVRVGPFRLSAEVDLGLLDARLEQVLGRDWHHPLLDYPPGADEKLLAPDSQSDDPAGVAKAICHRILAVAGHLQRSARLPAFPTGILVRAKKGAGSPVAIWSFEAFVPSLDEFAADIPEAACKKAVETVQWCAGLTPAVGLAELQSWLDRQFVQPMSRLTRETGTSGIYIATGAFLAGVPFRYVGSGHYVLGWGSRAIRNHRSSFASDSAIGSRLVTNKFDSAAQLRLAGLPTPEHRLVESETGALEAARMLGWPVVVKPNDRERGEGVTTAIRTETVLQQAFADARKCSARVLVEREVEGVCHRINVVRGRVILAVKRSPVQITGDGLSPIGQLIQAQRAANDRLPRWRRAQALPDDQDAVEWLFQHGLTLDSVPADGEAVPLRPRDAAEWGGHLEVVTDGLHPDNADICVRAARLLGLDMAGVDLMSTDVSVPWHENGAVVIEVNFAPSFAVMPKRFPILGDLVEALLPAGGRIPVDLILGGTPAMERGRQLQQERCASGERCFLVSAGSVLRPDGSSTVMPPAGLYARVRALLLDPDVDALVMVAHDGELLRTGFPVDRITHLESIGDLHDTALPALARVAERFLQVGEASVTRPARL